MFEAPRSKALDQFDLPAAPARTSPPPRRRARSVKVALAAGLLCAAVYAVIAGQMTITSTNAVLSAYTVSLRAPISGRFQGEGLRVGDAVAAGDILGRVEDALADGQGVVDLAGQVDRSEAEGKALAAQRAGLVAMRARLLQRVTEGERVEDAYQGHDLEAQTEGLRTLSARNRILRRALDRKQRLARDGLAPAIELQDLTDQLDASEGEIAAQDAAMVRTRVRQAAARRGLTPSETDASYSRQRIDDIDLRLSEVDRAIASYAAAEAEARHRLVAERARLGQLREAVLRAPSAGTVWRLAASDGERLGVGDAAFEMVDCRAGFILAAIPQDRFGEVEIGGMARFRLSGERDDRYGRILGVMATADLAGDRNLAAAPAPGHGETVLARIEVQAGDGPCAVGRTARVLLQVDADGGPVARLARWIFG